MLRLAATGRLVIIDLAAVSVVDSAGVSALISGMGEVREAGGEVELHSATALLDMLRAAGVSAGAPSY